VGEGVDVTSADGAFPLGGLFATSPARRGFIAPGLAEREPVKPHGSFVGLSAVVAASSLAQAFALKPLRTLAR
jgi:hypothetical protein